MLPLKTRILSSLAFGFAVVFAFAFFMQGSTEFMNWLLGFHIRFLFPGGAALALNDPLHLLSVFTSLTFTSLVVALIFFLIKSRPRRSLLWDDDEDENA